MENVDGADRLFCKHWQCETPQCAEEDQVTWPDGCNACPGSYILQKITTMSACVYMNLGHIIDSIVKTASSERETKTLMRCSFNAY